MKKSLSFLFCVCLLIGICAAAHAETDVSKIQPDGVTPGIIDTGYVYMYTTPDGTTVVIPHYHDPYYSAPITTNTNTNKEETKKEETKDTNTSTVETNKDVDEPTNKEDVDKTPAAPSDKKELIDEIFKLVNEERKNAGLHELNYNMELQNAADIRARECAEQFSHTRPDGTSCFTVVEEIDYSVVGENLIKADNPIATAKALVNSWMNSEGHRANILNADFTETAIGIYISDGITYGAQIFMG